MNYPEEWNQLSKRERKKKLKALKRQRRKKAELIRAIRNWSLVVVILMVGVFGYAQLTKKSPEQIEFEEQVSQISLAGKVEEFPIEGRNHVAVGASVNYQTNPPTSGGHLGVAKNWGIYDEAIDDKAGVHNLEHGGIWISYKDVSAEEIEILEDIGRQNSQSTVVSPRPINDDRIVVASWGKMMRLDVVDRALIQKYISIYKNQSPEKLAR